MFGWLAALKNWLRPERCLFRYWDGTKKRAIDPLVAYRAIWIDPDCDLIRDAATARNPTKLDGSGLYPLPMVYEAEDRLRAMTRRIFGVAEWSEVRQGLTADETDNLLNCFMEFCADLKKKRSPSPTESAPTASKEPPSSPDTEMQASSPAGVGPDYCFSATESTAAAPTGP